MDGVRAVGALKFGTRPGFVPRFAGLRHGKERVSLQY
jgi:hypothetical protein